MNSFRLLTVLLFLLFNISANACRYTIREIGFSTLSKVSYLIYRVDENSAIFPNQQKNGFSQSNVDPYALNFTKDKTNPIIEFVKRENLTFPAYVLVDPSGRMLELSNINYNNNLKKRVLSSRVQNELVKNLPINYASVVLVEGNSKKDNEEAKKTILEACEHIVNIMPNMPKQVDFGPNMIVINQNQIEEEKVLLWSLGIEKNPETPIAFVTYAKGRIMGEKIDFEAIKAGDVYKLLSIIGADCECGLDRKWLLGYQIPLDWSKETRQNLSDDLGFDVDNPMVLTEMSRILAIENKIPKDPDGISFEPIVIDLEEEFNDIPKIEHKQQITEQEANVDSSTNKIIWYSLVFLVLLIAVGAYVIIKRK